MSVLTKDQIIAQLQLIPVDRLQKLYDYANTLMIPEEDLLVNVNMAQMLAKAFTLADTYFPQWTDRGFTDFGRFVVELACLFSEKDFWYINAYASESIFDRISVFSDAFVRAIVLGYDPVVCRSASATFNITFDAGADYTYPIGTLQVSVPGPVAGTNYIFTNNDVIFVPASGAVTTLAVTLYEGNSQADNIVYNGHNIIIDKPLIDTESIILQIDNLQWAHVRTFGRSSANSPHFIVVPEENGALTIYFGEDGYGITPALSTPMKVYYRTTKGSDGNIPLSFAAQIISSATSRNSLGINMLSDATGGSLPETLASIKMNVPLYFSSKQAAINVSITEALMLTYPEVKRVTATPIGNVVYFRIVPSDGSVASPALLTTLAARLTPNLMLGYTCLGQQTTYVDVSTVNISAYVLKGYDTGATATSIKQLVQDFTDPLVMADYGISFDLTNISLLLRSQIPGLQNVVFNTVQSTTPQTIVVDPDKILTKIPDGNITVTVYVIQ